MVDQLSIPPFEVADLLRWMLIDGSGLGTNHVEVLKEWYRLVADRAPEESAAVLLALIFAASLLRDRMRSWTLVELDKSVAEFFPHYRTEPEITFEWLCAGRADLARLGFILTTVPDAVTLTWPASHWLRVATPAGSA
jgi:hypothetical protein